MPFEFDCCECHRHIVLICGDQPEPPLCSACLLYPQWWEEPDLKRVFDPNNEIVPNPALP